MTSSRRNILAILVCTAWVNLSEFLRNDILLKTYWTNHYRAIGVVFPSAPINGAVWIAWGFLFALSIYLLSKQFNLVKTALISWLMGFVLMWIVTWNLNVLPKAILIYAIPLSLLETFVGSYICAAVSPAKRLVRAS
jgi:hypothetical protein